MMDKDLLYSPIILIKINKNMKVGKIVSSDDLKI